MEFIMILLLISILLAYTFLIIIYLEVRDIYVDVENLKEFIGGLEYES